MSVVYKIPCKYSLWSYIGGTDKRLQTGKTNTLEMLRYATKDGTFLIMRGLTITQLTLKTQV